MAQATLTAPLTINPAQVTKLVLRSCAIDFQAKNLSVRIDMVDATGNVLEQKSLILDGAQVQTWIDNNESTLYTRLLAKLGVSGTVA